MEDESLRHNVIMILLDVLMTNEQPLSVKELVSKLGHCNDYSTFSKGLRRITGRGTDGLPVQSFVYHFINYYFKLFVN